MTLAATVREAAARFGDAAAIVADAGWTLSYAELDRLSDEVAAGLAAAGVGEGDLVALTLPSTPDYVVAYAALAKLGAITAGVNPRYTPAEQHAVIAVAQPTLVIGTTDGPGRLAVDIASAADEILAILRTGSGGSGGSGASGGSGGSGASIPVLADLDDPDRLVAIVFTSGTTGTPKGAMFTNRELAAITTSDVGDRWGGGASMLAATQFAHVGFMTKLPWYLRLGTTIHLLDRWRATDVLRLVHEHRLESIGGVAPQVALMLRAPDFDTYDVTCVKTIIMGGAPSPPALVREARERFGAAYSIRYSSTESGGVGTGTAFDADDEEAFFTVGRPRGDVKVDLRDEHGRSVPDGEVGEICLRSSCMMRGYWRDAPATAATLRDGWLHTGDLGAFDERGLLRIAGRIKEMYIRGGYNVYPVEVEAVLASHPGVKDVAVVPRADEVMGEIGVAVVVPRPTEPAPTLEDLRRFARERLSSHKLPEALETVADLPLTAMLKVDRRALRARFGGAVDHTG